MSEHTQLSHISAQQLLEAMDGIAYLTAIDGKILAVSTSSWEEFSTINQAPHLTPEHVIGKIIFDLFQGEEIRKAYHAMHDAVCDSKRSEISFAYRCDSPETERHMHLCMKAVRDEGEVIGVLYQSQLVDALPRAPMEIFSHKRLITLNPSYRFDQILSLCSYCHDVAWPIGAQRERQDWIKPEEYYRRAGTNEVVVSHGICPSCYDTVVQPNI